MRIIANKRASKPDIAPKDDVFQKNLSPEAKILLLLGSSIIIYFTTWVFYESHLICLLSLPLSIILLKNFELAYKKHIKEEIEDEFSDLNRLIIAELEANIPIEQALKNIEQRISKDDIYEFKHINKELKRWTNELDMGLRLEDILIEFANRSDDKNFKDYAKMVSLSSKTGSKLYDVIVNTNQVLEESKELKRELSVLIAEKKLEQRLMSLMPLFIVLMLKSTAPEFIAPLYKGVEGRIVMSLVLSLFVISYFWSKRMAKLK